MVAYGSMAERVVITGAGAISPFGDRLEDLRAALLARQTALREVDRFDVSECRSHRAAMLHGFDASRYIDAQKLRRIDEIGRLAIASCRLALEDGGNPAATNAIHADRIGVVYGSFTVGTTTTISYLTNLIRQGAAGVSAMTFSNTVGNAAASLCGLEFGLRGPNVTMTVKEASGVAAAAYATDLIRDGRADAIVAGGVDWIDDLFFRVHDRFGVLAHPNGAVDESSRPFDRRRNGFALGEGAYAVLLESASSASARGARVLGELLGTAATGSTTAINTWSGDPAQMARAMRDALADARLAPEDVGVVFAAANSNDVLDRVEAEAIARVFGEATVPVASVKGVLGESSATTLASLVAAIACVSRGEVPPTSGLEQLDARCPVNASADLRTPRSPVAMINAFASGGTNQVLVAKVLPQS
jgi:3-oxoacyl-[acyl-carrier-protein] synthase II